MLRATFSPLPKSFPFPSCQQISRSRFSLWCVSSYLSSEARLIERLPSCYMSYSALPPYSISYSPPLCSIIHVSRYHGGFWSPLARTHYGPSAGDYGHSETALKHTRNSCSCVLLLLTTHVLLDADTLPGNRTSEDRTTRKRRLCGLMTPDAHVVQASAQLGSPPSLLGDSGRVTCRHTVVVFCKLLQALGHCIYTCTKCHDASGSMIIPDRRVKCAVV